MNRKWTKGIAVLLISMLCIICSCAAAESAAGEISLPAGLTIIEEEAFANTTGVSHVTVPEGTVEIGARAFAGSSLQTIRLPESLKVIAGDAFEGVSGLTASGTAGSYAQEYCEAHGIPFSTYVQAPYPESAHPYEPGVEKTWHWQGDENAKSLKITFGENCELSGDDSITLYDQYGNWVYRYYDTDLQGRTKVVSGNAFSISLLSYSDTPAYGFDIVSIEEDYVNQPVTVVDVTAETTYADGWTEMTWTVDAESTYLPISYQYMVLLYGNRHYTTTSSSNVFSYKVENSVDFGSYSLAVRVMDAQDNSLYFYDDEQIEVEEVHYEMLYVTPDVTSIPAGNTVNWVAEAQSTAYQLTYTHILEKDGVEIVRQSEVREKGEPASFSYVPLEPGVYTLTVEADMWGSVISLASVPVVVTDYEVLPEADFTYTMLSETEVEITGYTGTSTAMIIPDTIAGAQVVSIAAEAFQDDTSLNVLVLPDTLRTINSYAFRRCTGLQIVDLGQGVQEIWHDVFEGCTSIRELDFPASVTTLGSAVLASCTSLTRVGYPVNLSSAQDSIFSNCTSLKSIDVPHGVTALPAYVFEYANMLETVTLPDTLLFVGFRAFARCSSLREATLPDSVEQLCEEAFYECTSLASFHYPFNWTTWTNEHGDPLNTLHNLLGGCPLITRIEVPEGVTEIPMGAFASCEYIEEVILPSTLIAIEQEAFAGCTGITKMTFPESLRAVGKWAFMNCTNLEEALLPDGVEELLDGVFLNCSALTSFHYPRNLTVGNGDEIGPDGSKYGLSWYGFGVDYSFGSLLKGCTKITTIEIPEGVTSIPRYTFYDCPSIVDVVFPEGLLHVGTCAFTHCTSLIEADLPDSVERLVGAFSGCTSLELFHYPMNWWRNQEDDYWEASPIYDCPLITTLEVPEGVTIIPYSAFYGSNYLEEVILPSSLVEIGIESFKDCERLSRVYIPASVQLIGQDAFADCPSLGLTCEWGTEAAKYAEENGLDCDYLTLNGAVYPNGTWYQGDAFTFRGYLHSGQTVSHLSVGIYDMDGNMLQGTAVSPDAKSIRLKTAIGDTIDLSVLELGTYRFQLKATVGDVQKTVVDSTFIVTPPPSRVMETYMNIPSGLLVVGEPYNFGGTLVSVYEMDKVTATIESELTGVLMREFVAESVGKNFGVYQVTDAMNFTALPEGSYIFRIMVEIDGETNVEVESRFKLYDNGEGNQRARALDTSLRGSTSAVDNNLLYESMVLSKAAYREAQATSSLETLGFQNVDDPKNILPEQYSHTIGHFFGWKDMLNDDGTTTRVYAIICRGTAPYEAEWLSNFTFEGHQYYHYGFHEAALNVLSNFLTYMEEHHPEDREFTDCKIWVTGHSRGAAVANLLGGALLPEEGFDRDNTFVYTFACPLVSIGSTADAYNIFNYNIGGDFVPRVPLAHWGYNRFGHTTTLENTSYAFGKNLIDNDVLDRVMAKLETTLLEELAQEELTDVVKEMENYDIEQILPELWDALIDLHKKYHIWELIDVNELVSFGPTHDSGTYLQWISSIT